MRRAVFQVEGSYPCSIAQSPAFCISSCSLGLVFVREHQATIHQPEGSCIIPEVTEWDLL